MTRIDRELYDGQVMNHNSNNTQFPTYWSEKRGTTIIIRMSADKGITVHGNNKFQYRHKTHFGSKILMEDRLTSFKEISIEEFNISQL